MNPSPPITITTQLARSPLPVTGERQVAYVLVELHASEILAATARLPVNVNFVLDRSSTMRGQRLQAMKQALCQVIDTLGPDDIFSAVTFDDLVDLVIPAQPVDDPDRLKAAIDLIEDGGGTALSLGLGLGMAEAQRHASPDRASRIIVLIDGQTAGDEAQCRALASEAGTAGIQIVPIGYGAEWDDAFLEDLGRRSGGPPPDYVQTPSDLHRHFAHQMQTAHDVALRGVRLSVRFVTGVTPRHVTCIAPFLRNVDDAIRSEERAVDLTLGDLERDAPLGLLFEVVIEPKRGGTFRIAQIEATAQGLAEDISPVRADVVVTFSATKPSQVEPIVAHYVERALASRLVARALEPAEGVHLPPFAPNIMDLFDAEGRDCLVALQSGGPLSPEMRKALLSQVWALTRVRRQD